MTVPITLELPESLAEQAQRIGTITQQKIETVLLDALEIIGLTWNYCSEETLPRPVATLSDAEVVTLALAKMAESQHQRLGELQARGKAGHLSEPERYELLALLQVYQLGLLRKAEAIAEAKARHLTLPLNA